MTLHRLISVAMSSENWSLTKEQRNQVVDQTGANLFNLAFSAEKDLDQLTAAESAQRLEVEAYASAQAQSTTTTGVRPLKETLLAYVRYRPWGNLWSLNFVRKLAELVVEFVKSFSASTRNGVVESEVRITFLEYAKWRSFDREQGCSICVEYVSFCRRNLLRNSLIHYSNKAKIFIQYDSIFNRILILVGGVKY